MVNNKNIIWPGRRYTHAAVIEKTSARLQSVKIARVAAIRMLKPAAVPIRALVVCIAFRTTMETIGKADAMMLVIQKVHL